MKIILLADVPKVGKKWEVKEVSTGFARNHLLPKNLAETASPSAMTKIKARKEKDTAAAEQSLKYTQDLASKIDGLEIEIPVKLNKKGEPYRSISPQMVVSVLKEMGFNLEKRSVTVEEQSGGPGEYSVKIALDHGLEADITANVVDEEEKSSQKEPE